MPHTVLFLVALAASTLPDAGTPSTLEVALQDYDSPQFISPGPHPCVMQFEMGEAETARLRVAQFAALEPSAAQLQEWSWQQGAELEAGTSDRIERACGESMRRVAALALTSCRSPEAFAALLEDPATADLRAPDARWSARVDRNYWQAADEFGCARVVTSADGRTRAWKLGTEGLREEGDEGTGTVRYVAFFQWRDAAGKLHVHRDRTPVDFHLDAIIDAIEPLPGSADRFVVLGLRAYSEIFVGDRPRRFAEIVRLGGSNEDAELVRGSFRVAGQPADRLLLTAPVPETGKFRHNLLARSWLVFDPAQRRLMLEDIPGSKPGRPAVTVATLRGKTFVVTGRRWDGIALARRWGTRGP